LAVLPVCSHSSFLFFCSVLMQSKREDEPWLQLTHQNILDNLITNGTCTCAVTVPLPTRMCSMSGRWYRLSEKYYEAWAQSGDFVVLEDDDTNGMSEIYPARTLKLKLAENSILVDDEDDTFGTTDESSTDKVCEHHRTTKPSRTRIRTSLLMHAIEIFQNLTGTRRPYRYWFYKQKQNERSVCWTRSLVTLLVYSTFIFRTGNVPVSWKT
jgi:hypothetical protein